MSGEESTIRKCKNIRDRLYPREQRPATIFREEVVRLLSADSVVLDIGCGREALFLRSLLPYAGTAYGIDLEIAETCVDGRMTTMHGDAAVIPLPDQSVDVITMVNVVEHLPEPGRVFRQCRRVLKPGGALLMVAPCNLYWPIALGRVIPHRLRQWANVVATGTQCEDTFPAYYRANSERALRRIASCSGLSVIRIRHLLDHPAYFMFSTLVYRCAIVVERHILGQEVFRRFRPKILCQLRKPTASDPDANRPGKVSTASD